MHGSHLRNRKELGCDIKQGLDTRIQRDPNVILRTSLVAHASFSRLVKSIRTSSSLPASPLLPDRLAPPLPQPSPPRVAVPISPVGVGENDSLTRSAALNLSSPSTPVERFRLDCFLATDAPPPSSPLPSLSPTPAGRAGSACDSRVGREISSSRARWKRRWRRERCCSSSLSSCASFTYREVWDVRRRSTRSTGIRHALVALIRSADA